MIVTKISVIICFALIASYVSNPTSIGVRPRPRNDPGCDVLIDSCGSNGGCCDEHDDCYEINKCTANSWFGTESEACSQCNLDVINCIVTRNPGPSRCCQGASKCCSSNDEICMESR